MQYALHCNTILGDVYINCRPFGLAEINHQISLSLLLCLTNEGTKWEGGVSVGVPFGVGVGHRRIVLNISVVSYH